MTTVYSTTGREGNANKERTGFASPATDNSRNALNQSDHPVHLGDEQQDDRDDRKHYPEISHAYGSYYRSAAGSREPPALLVPQPRTGSYRTRSPRAYLPPALA